MVGWNAIINLTGPTGPTGPNIIATYLNSVWLPETTYNLNDVVIGSVDNNTYICIQSDGSGSDDPVRNAASWALFAEGGPTGPSGPAGTATPLIYLGVWYAQYGDGSGVYPQYAHVVSPIDNNAYVCTNPSGSINHPGIDPGAYNQSVNPSADWTLFSDAGPTGPTGPAGTANPLTYLGLWYSGYGDGVYPVNAHVVSPIDNNAYVCTNPSGSVNYPGVDPSANNQNNNPEQGPPGDWTLFSDAGPTGPTGPTGPGLTPTYLNSLFSVNISYNLNDVVIASDNNTYICVIPTAVYGSSIDPTTQNDPPNNQWGLLAQGGTRILSGDFQGGFPTIAARIGDFAIDTTTGQMWQLLG